VQCIKHGSVVAIFFNVFFRERSAVSQLEVGIIFQGFCIRCDPVAQGALCSFLPWITVLIGLMDKINGKNSANAYSY